MTQQVNKQVFAYAKQFADNAFKTHALALQGWEQIVDLQLQEIECQLRSVSNLTSQAAKARDPEALRDLWEEGFNLSREHAEHFVAISRDIIAVGQKTAESLGTLAQARTQVVNSAVSASISEAAAKKTTTTSK